MAFRILMFCLLIGLLTSCKQQDKEKLPPGIISPTGLADILTDIHLAEAGALEIKGSRDSTQAFINEQYQIIFSLHQINSEKFEKSYRYYLKNPHLLSNVYEQVIANLSILEEQVIYGKDKDPEEIKQSVNLRDSFHLRRDSVIRTIRITDGDTVEIKGE